MRALGDLITDSFTSTVYASPVANQVISQSGGLFDPSPSLPPWAWVAGTIALVFLIEQSRKRR